MAGIEISEEITEDQLEAMSWRELLKQEVRFYRRIRWPVLKSLRKLQKINWRQCLGESYSNKGKIVQKMAGIEISEEITEDQVVAMSGGELLKQEVRLYRRWPVFKSPRKLPKINWRQCLGESYSNKR